MSTPEEENHGPVIKDRRRIDPVTGLPRQAASAAAGVPGDLPADGGPGGQQPSSSRPGKHAVSKPGVRAEPAADGTAAASTEGAGTPGSAALLAERTADLQRVQAEYANYRKRVERDRAAVRELALTNVLTGLLPVLDDIGRARLHGELEGGFKAVAESLEATVAKLGMTTFGEPGDAFDPNVHEALMHAYSPDVTEPTCVQILQPGYRVGERIVRPARVAVAEPAEDAEPEAADSSPGDTD